MRQPREMTIEEFEKELLEMVEDTFTIQVYGEDNKSVITIRTQSGYELVMKVDSFKEALAIASLHVFEMNRLFSANAGVSVHSSRRISVQ